MITIDRNVLIIGITLIALTLVPMAAANARPVFEEIAALPIVALIELLIYFIAVLVMNPRATLGMALVTSMCYTVLRAVCSLVGGSFALLFLPENPDFNIFLPWLNPVSGVVQGVVLITAGPYLLALMIPELIGRRESEQLLAGRTDAEQRSSQQVAIETSPTGGFIQVFSYPELAAQLKKNPGLEGFIIYSDEGLVVWEDLPLKVDSEELACKLMNYTHSCGQLMVDSGLARVRRFVLESREHHILATTLNQNFGMILIYNGRTPIQQIYSRLSVIAKTSREFLQWRYPSLPLATGMTKDRIPLELV